MYRQLSQVNVFLRKHEMQPTTEWQTEIFEGRVGVEEGVQNIAAAVNELFEATG